MLHFLLHTNDLMIWLIQIVGTCVRMCVCVCKELKQLQEVACGEAVYICHVKYDRLMWSIGTEARPTCVTFSTNRNSLY